MVSVPLIVVNGLVTGGILILMALGMTLIFGVMDVINFAHGAFFTIGAYVTFYLASINGWNLLLSIVAAAILISILGVIIDQTFIRMVRDRSVWVGFLVTLGIGYSLQSLVEIFAGPNPRYFQTNFGTIQFLGITYGTARIGVAMASFALIAAIFVFLNYSTTGKQIRAVAQNPVGSQLVGIQPERIYLITFGVGAGLAGIAGSLNGILFPLSPPMGELAIVNAFIVIIIGGLGSISGAAFAGLLLGLIQSLASVFLSNTEVALIFYLVLVVILLIRPEGLASLWGDANA